MEFLLIVALGVAVVLLWNRVDRLERQMRDFEHPPLGYSEHHIVPATRTKPDFEPEPVATPSVPLVQEGDEPEQVAEEAHSQPSDIEPEPVFAADEEHEPADGEPKPWRSLQFDFEDLFGRKLPIWAGGITLAVAGVFLVRYSIESGLLTPIVRVALAFLFGFVLLGGAEWAYRNEQMIADERVRQSLAGAGLATLYAAFYLAGTQYGLIGQSVAFLGLALVTGGAIALSFRFGLPCAILGLVGGFAAPALVGGEEANLPLLSLYLGLVTAGLTTTGKRQSRPWLSIAALVVGLGWGALLLLVGDPGVTEILALGLYFVVLGAVLPSFSGAEGYDRPLRLGAAFVASVQLALLVHQGGYVPLTWALYLLMGATLAFFAWQRPELRETSAIAATVAVLLLAQWHAPEPMFFAIVCAGIAAIYAGVALAHLWRGQATPIDIAQIAAVPFALAAIVHAKFGGWDADLFEPELAAAFVGLAAFPIAASWRVWHKGQDDVLAILLGVGTIMAFGAALSVTPRWLSVVMAATTFAGLFALLRGRDSRWLQSLLWGSAIITLYCLVDDWSIAAELEHLIGSEREHDLGRALIRWSAALLPWVALAWHETNSRLRGFAEVMTALLAYGLVAQFLPDEALTWVAATGAIAVWHFQRTRSAAQWTLVVLTALWALAPLVAWALNALEALGGDPMYLRDVPDVRELVLRVLPFAAALTVIRFRTPHTATATDTRIPILALPVLIVVVHSLFKQLFAIDTNTDFITYGLAERTLWQGLLLGGAVLLHRGVWGIAAMPKIAMLLAGTALAHALWFTGLIHNPLWDRQAVGPTPVANLVLIAGTIATLAAVLLRNRPPVTLRPTIDGLTMLVVSVTALALLRQLFAGTILIDEPMSQTEDLLRSLLGIVLALGFLLLGKWRDERSWRIGSLVLILLAVAKVFLVDAAGLEGLLRIASFMALGFSLIGIGWFYARQLKPLESKSELD